MGEQKGSCTNNFLPVSSEHRCAGGLKSHGRIKRRNPGIEAPMLVTLSRKLRPAPETNTITT
jgi:hypothetical protein